MPAEHTDMSMSNNGTPAHRFRRNIRDYLLRPILIILISGIAGYLLLVLVYCLPTESMKDNMLSGARIYLTEGLEYEYAEGYKSSILDNETDGIMLSETLYASGNPFADAALVPRMVYTSAEGSIYSLLGILQEDDSSEPVISTYPNYWHGYLVLLKPFYLMFDFADMRIFNLTCILGVMFLLIAALYRINRQHFLMPLLAMLVFWNPATISMCIQLSDCYYISLLASCFLLNYFRSRLYQTTTQPAPPISSNSIQSVPGNATAGTTSSASASVCIVHKSNDSLNLDLTLIFLIIGVLTVYFDFLTYPIVTLCVPLTICLICSSENKPVKSICRVLICSIYWAAGYVGMWIMKWVIGSLTTGQNLFSGAFAKLAERSGTEVAETSISRIETVLLILKTCFKWPYLILTCAVVVILFLLSRRQYHMSATSEFFKGTSATADASISNRTISIMTALIPYIFVALIPLAWIFVTANHAYIHPRLTYRDIGASIFAVLSGISAQLFPSGNNLEE